MFALVSNFHRNGFVPNNTGKNEASALITEDEDTRLEVKAHERWNLTFTFTTEKFAF